MSYFLKSQDKIEVIKTIEGLTLKQTDNVGEASIVTVDHQNIDNFLDILQIVISEKIKK